MGELKRTQMYQLHVDEGATMVDFGGWDMPVQYPTGILAEHLYTRRFCGLFDVCHMGRLIFKGPDMLKFLQHVISSNAAEVQVGKAQYCILPAENGSAVDDAYLYRFYEDSYLLVVNAGNVDKDKAWFETMLTGYDVTMTDVSREWGCIAVQGPKSEELLTQLAGGEKLTEPKRNNLTICSLQGREMWIARTGYTGEPVGFEVFGYNDDIIWLWHTLEEMGAKPAGLGARDTLRLEAGLPLYGHEMGKDEDGNFMPIYAVPLAKFAVSFAEEKGDFVGKEALAGQYEALQKMNDGDFSQKDALPRRIHAIALEDRGVIREGMAVWQNGKQVGWVTSGTMVPYYIFDGKGADAVPTEKTAKRSIGTCYIDSEIQPGEAVEVEVRGKMLKASVVKTHLSVKSYPYARPIVFNPNK